MLAGNVLVVESCGSAGRQLVSMLDGFGHGARHVLSAEQGLEVLGRRSFDVVLSAVCLGGVDGIELVRRMQESDPLLVPVIMTSRDDQATAIRALEIGVRIFLRKPIHRPVLRDRLQEALRSRQREAEQRQLFADLLRMRAALQETVVTQHRQLAETEGYLNDLLDAAPFGVVSTGRDGRVLTLNRTAQRLYQRTESEALGSGISELFGSTTSGPASRGEHARKDGTRFPVLVRERRILDDGEQHIAQLYVIEDLSESESLREQLLYAERLSVLGQMAPRIAHEFKTPLQIISGFTELALIHADDGDLEQTRSSLQAVLPAAQELTVLVRQIADLGRPQQSRIEKLDLSQEIDKVLQPLQQIGVLKHCSLVRHTATRLPLVQGDPTQIEQVLRNLIVNAAHAMEGRERRVLYIEVTTLQDPTRVVCRIRDTGAGILPDDLERVFQPFYTTKEPGKGTGLGLPIVKSVLDRHGATLELESKPEEGTTFTMTWDAEVDSGAAAKTHVE